MSRTRFLILLCVLVSLAGCGYGFVLKGSGNLGPVNLAASRNQTILRAAGMVLDSHLEQDLAALGVFKPEAGLPVLTCTVVSATTEEITAKAMGANRFRLTLGVQAQIDRAGKVVWQAHFSDNGTYASGGQEEDALDEACDKISARIGQAVLAVKVVDTVPAPPQ